MEEWDRITAALTEGVDAVHTRQRASPDDPAVHLVAELLQAALTAAGAVTGPDHPERCFRRVLDHLRAATAITRFGLVAEADRRRSATTRRTT
ncbi:hypothetical protein [Saccharothrix sp. HUAS TT1]|uniref:hypothetical protein n=1 Tax=unclassified Saccharothrix TaxID=2593673 RepID=UPI00345BCE8B